MSALISKGFDDTLETLLSEVDGPILVIDPSRSVIEELIEVAIAMDDPPLINLLADETVVKEVMRDFLIASNAADLIQRETLKLRTAELAPSNALLITEEWLTALVTVGNDFAALPTDDDSFVDDAYEFYRNAWDTADSYTLRTPPLSAVRESLREEIGAEAEEDFDAIITSLETARGDGTDLDEVTISLLVAAKSEALLYDISKWGEDIGIASKATFSRTKTTLEELGLIGTEKVPIDVGRPRLRLKFADDRLENANAAELASIAQSLL